MLRNAVLKGLLITYMSCVFYEEKTEILFCGEYTTGNFITKTNPLITNHFILQVR